jgi:hypothetical protein
VKESKGGERGGEGVMRKIGREDGEVRVKS